LAELSEESLVTLYRDETYRSVPGRTPRSLAELVRQWKRDREGEVVMQVGSFESGVASIAAPVRDMSGNVVAAINATQALSSEATREMEERVRAEVLATAAAISRLLGARPAAA